MNREKFLKELDELLKDISEDDRKEILFDYNEHFQVGLAEGRTEEDIAKSLGEPKVIAKEIRVFYKINKAEKNKSAGNIFRAVFATLGLGFFNLVFILGPFIAMVGVIIAFYASSGAVIFSGVSLFIGTLLEPLLPQFINIPVNFFVSIFASIGLTSLGILWMIGTTYLTKYFYKITVKYLKMNQNIIMNRRDKSDA